MAYPENNNTDFNGARQNVGGGSFANTGENANPAFNNGERPQQNSPQGGAYSQQGAQNGGFNQNNGFNQNAGFNPNNGYNSNNGYNQNGGFNQNNGSYNGAYGNTSPSQIYNAYNNNGAPQYHYGRPIPMMDNRYYYEQQQRMAKLREQKRNIRKAASFPGIAMFLFLGAGSVFSAVLLLSNFRELYLTNSLFCSAMGIFYSVFTVALPFTVAGLIYKSKDKSLKIPLGASKLSPLKTALLIMICFGGCLLANYATSIIVSFFESMGIIFEYSTGPDPTNLTEVIFLFVGTAIIPPLTEELAMRGFVMQSLKKYGNAFAIIASAFVFSVFHGNPTQIPFAFICGLFLGYAAMASGSLWVSIAVHAMVNSLSCLYSAITLYSSEETAGSVVGIITGVFLLAGVISLVVYLVKFKKEDNTLSVKGESDLSTGTKFKYFITNPLIIIATVIFFAEAAMQISFAS